MMSGPTRYTGAQMERAETHDAAWNAAIREMCITGYMHNCMRMYWGKKIIHWCNTPQYACAHNVLQPLAKDRRERGE